MYTWDSRAISIITEMERNINDKQMPKIKVKFWGKLTLKSTKKKKALKKLNKLYYSIRHFSTVLFSSILPKTRKAVREKNMHSIR